MTAFRVDPRTPVDLRSPLSLLFCLLALSSLRPAAGCRETAWSRGFMTPENAALLDTVATTSSCYCCALCYRLPSCSSLAVSKTDGQCRLYGNVANYSTLTPDAGWTYLVRPRRSREHEFCRTDADCTDGTPCRGRLCTKRNSVTCRVVRNELGACDRYGDLATSTRMFGWVANQTVALACLFTSDRPGYTRLFQNRVGFRYTRETIRRYGTMLSSGLTGPHSMLYLAEKLRALRDDATYHLLIESPGLVTIELEVPRDEPVLSSEARPLDALSGVTYARMGRRAGTRLSLPYMPAEGVTLMTLNAAGSKWHNLAVAREDGRLSWGGDLDPTYIYMLE